MKKSLICIILLLLVLLAAVAACGEEQIYTSGKFSYRLLEDDSAEITKCRTTDVFGESVSIPDTLDGHPVTSIADSAFAQADVTSVTIPNSVTSVGINPFGSGYKLTQIKLSPDHPTLALIDGVLFSKPDKRLVYYPYNLKAESYTIPSGIKIIGGQAFRNGRLQNLVIPESVETIEAFAFWDCGSLKQISFPQGTVRIADSAFDGCRELETVEFSDTVTELGQGVFTKCYALRSIAVSPENPALALVDGLLYSTADHRLVVCPNGEHAEAYQIQDGTETIGDGAFCYCKGLKSIVLPDSVIKIGNSAFENCEALTDVQISSNLTAIGKKAFSSCNSLVQMTLPEGLLSIGEGAFQFNKNLEKINIPESVNDIGHFAFSSCDKLKITVVRGSFGDKYCVSNKLKH